MVYEFIFSIVLVGVAFTVFTVVFAHTGAMPMT